MTKKLYKFMDWAGIEGICYGDEKHPEEYLGPRNTGLSTLVQGFFPGAKSVVVVIGEGKKQEEIKAEKADDAGYFAALLPGKDRKDYVYQVTYDNKDVKELIDPYAYTSLLKESDLDSFVGGHEKHAYKFMGAHMESHKGVKGCRFAVWAPTAQAVSVVGDFNDWNPLCHQMMLRDPFGVYEIFIPEAKAGDHYKYSILVKGNERKLKADPYGVSFEESNERASVIVDERPYRFTDKDYKRETDLIHKPYNSYEVFLGNYLYDGDHYAKLKNRIPTLVNYVKEMGYTHIELTPIFEYHKEETMGYAPLNFFATTARYGEVATYKKLVDEAHKNGIGVIVQWPVNCFDYHDAGLMNFDGSCLYEHEDPRKGVDQRNGYKLFNYERPEVKCYLMSSLSYLLEEFHFDGVKFCDTASMLYLDYFRAPGEWEANIYGGNENLGAIAFMKKCNDYVHKNYEGVFTIAEDESTYPGMTLSSSREDKIGFDLTANEGFNFNLLEYMRHDPYERKNFHDRLTLSSFYYTNEAYTIGLSQRHVNYGKGGAMSQMPGSEEEKIANMKALFAYNTFHPGKKKNLSGQEFGEYTDFYVGRPMETELLKNDAHQELLSFVKDLNHFYLAHPAFYESDQEEGGFNWVHSLSAEDNLLTFTRKANKSLEEFFILMNFAGAEKECYPIGVPTPGRYEEVFVLGREEEKKAYESVEESVHGRTDSIKVNLPAFSAVVLKCKPYSQEELNERARIKAELEKKRQEELRKKKELQKEKARIRKSLKEELARKFREAETAILSGSEKEKPVKKTNAKGKTNKK